MEIIYNLEEINKVAEKLLDFLKTNNAHIVAFNAPMAAGKTTLIKAVCNLLGVKSEVTSPTFAIVNEYIAENSQNIYHFDFYRIETIEDALNIGVEDYFYSEDYCFIEWPEIVMPILPEDTIFVDIEITGDFERKLIAR